MNQKRILYVMFLFALWVPLVAVTLSPRFPGVAKNLLSRNADWDVEKETLRRSTPVWNGAVSLYNTLAYRIGASGNRAIAVVGDDGWVYLGDIFNRNFSQAIGRRTLSTSEVEGWSSALQGQARYLQESGIGFVVVVAPAKWSVYRDKLPRWVGDEAVRTSFDELLAVRPALPLVDLRPKLIAARKDQDTYSKLNSHWTDYGAFVAWPSLADAIGRQLDGARIWRPALRSVQFTDEGNEYKGLMSIDAPNRWTGFVPEIAPPGYQIIDSVGRRQDVGWNTKTSLFDLPRVTYNSASPSPHRVLVFRDSMGDSISPFIQSSFREVIQIGHSLDTPSKRPDFIAAVERYSPDMVIVELTERYLDTPPPNPLYWRLASAYHAPNARALGVWGGSDNAAVELSPRGDAALSAYPLSIGLQNLPRARSHSSIVGARVLAKGPGRIEFRLKCADRPDRAQTESYQEGMNFLFFELKADDCDGTLILARDLGSANLTVRSIAIRQLQTSKTGTNKNEK